MRSQNLFSLTQAVKLRKVTHFFPHKCGALTMCQAMYSVFGIYSVFRFIAIVTLWGSCSFDSMD